MKVLHVSLGAHQTSQQQALKGIASEFRFIDWTKSPSTLDRDVNELVKDFKPDLTFMQLQREGLIKPETLKLISGKKVNWTGDVRNPIPNWYIKLAPYFDYTLFSNGHDVEQFRGMGLKAEYLNIGFEEKDYTPKGEIKTSGVVFMGNHYGHFPLSALRAEMVRTLPIEVYGNGWGNKPDLNENPQLEAAIYRGCKIAINLSHFDYDRYSSDRMLRIMACGAFCLSHRYKGIEKDFIEGVDVAAWSTIDELKEKIGYYLDNPTEAKIIAANGCKKVWENHKWSDRIKQLKSIIQ